MLIASSLRAQQFLPSGTILLGQSTYYAMADFNLDGRLDLVKVSAATSKLTTYLGQPDGVFTALPTQIDIDTPTGLAQGDFDADGRPDLVVLSGALFSEPSARVFLGTGTGGFTARPTLLLPDLVRGAATGDFDSDGNLDLAIVTATQGGSTLTFLRGSASGSLAQANLINPTVLPVPAGSVITDIQVADLNSDGRPDLVMAVNHTTGIGLATAIGDGRGSFTATANMGSQPPFSNPSPRLAVADFNSDQKPDVVMFGYLRDSVTVWFNVAGVLVPQPSSSVSAGAGPFDIAAADFDLDGRMDWAVSRQISSGTPQLLFGLGNGAGQVTLSPANPFPYGGTTPFLEVGDFNGDRRQDILIQEGNSDTFRALLSILPRPATLVAQEISFPQPADRGLTDGNLALIANANSGLPVVFAGMTSSVCTVNKGIATFVTTGTCTVLAMQPGDVRYSPAPFVQRSFSVSRNTQTITFAPLVDRTLDLSPFVVNATASSGLSVTFTASPANVCTVTGTTVILIAVGQCSVTASQAGNGTFPPATPVTRTFAVTPVLILGPLVQSIANAASYVLGTLTPASYGSLFGQRLTGASLRIRDAASVTANMELTFSGPTQVNFIVPASVAKGAATVIVTTPTGTAEFPITIATTAPGLFSANGAGQGLAAAQALIVNNDRTVTVLTVGDSTIPVRGGTEVYLVLYGTGIRGHSPTGVSVTVAGLPVELLYAGPQGTFPALDQINVRVPLTVGGFGNSEIRLVVDGVAANVVTAVFQ